MAVPQPGRGRLRLGTFSGPSRAKHVLHLRAFHRLGADISIWQAGTQLIKKTMPSNTACNKVTDKRCNFHGIDNDSPLCVGGDVTCLGLMLLVCQLRLEPFTGHVHCQSRVCLNPLQRRRPRGTPRAPPSTTSMTTKFSRNTTSAWGAVFLISPCCATRCPAVMPKVGFTDWHR